MPRKPTFRAKADLYIDSLWSQNYSSDTIALYKRRLDYIYQYWVKHDYPMDPRKVESVHVRTYLDSLRGLSSSTQRGRGTTLLGFLRFAKNEKLRDFRLKIRVSRSRVDWLTVEEASAVLLAAPNETIRAAMLLMLYTGLRREEVADLLLSDLHHDHIIVRQGKGRVSRRIPIRQGLLDALRPYLEWRQTLPGTHFLIHKNGRKEWGPWLPDGLSGALYRLGQSLGRHLSPHTLRRSFGRHLYKAGMPLQDIQFLYGHRSVETTIRYLGITDEDVADSLERFQPDY